MRHLYDAISPARIPKDATMVASYVNGQWPNYPQLVSMFPKAIHVSISVNAVGAADVLDVEQFDATPEQAPAWCTRMRTLGRIPTVYMNTATWSQVKFAFQNQKVMEPNYWVANYSGGPVIPPGAVAVQFQNTAGYDLSLVEDYWPGIDKPLEEEMSSAEFDTLQQEIADLKQYIHDIFSIQDSKGGKHQYSALTLAEWANSGIPTDIKQKYGI